MAAAATGGVLLLVEDEDAIGRLVKAYLEQQDGWTVVWIKTGEEAVAELRRHPVRLVVLDIGLPGVAGVEVGTQMPAHSKWWHPNRRRARRAAAAQARRSGLDPHRARGRLQAPGSMSRRLDGGSQVAEVPALPAPERE